MRGASRLAVGVGISPLAGLTVVAFGTSSPELAVSVGAALPGQADLALGNVVGSYIFNVLFIVGLSALIGALVVAQRLVRLEVPLMIGVSVLLLLLGLAWRPQWRRTTSTCRPRRCAGVVGGARQARTSRPVGGWAQPG